MNKQLTKATEESILKEYSKKKLKKKTKEKVAVDSQGWMREETRSMLCKKPYLVLHMCECNVAY